MMRVEVGVKGRMMRVVVLVEGHMMMFEVGVRGHMMKVAVEGGGLMMVKDEITIKKMKTGITERKATRMTAQFKNTNTEKNQKRRDIQNV
jgi:hypothetical protein